MIAIGIVTTAMGMGVPGYHLLTMGGDPTLVQMPEVRPVFAEEPLELFSTPKKEHFFSVQNVYSNLPEGKFFNKNPTQKMISRKINEKLIFHTPNPWKKNIKQEDAISVAVEGILFRKRSSKVEALLVTPVGQYWFSNKIDVSELNSGRLIELKVIQKEEHSIAKGENQIYLSFYYDKASKSILIQELSIQLKLKLMGGLELQDSIIFSNLRAGYSEVYTQRPEYGAFELDDDQ